MGEGQGSGQPATATAAMKQTTPADGIAKATDRTQGGKSVNFLLSLVRGSNQRRSLCLQGMISSHEPVPACIWAHSATSLCHHLLSTPPPPLPLPPLLPKPPPPLFPLKPQACQLLLLILRVSQMPPEWPLPPPPIAIAAAASSPLYPPLPPLTPMMARELLCGNC